MPFETECLIESRLVMTEARGAARGLPQSQRRNSANRRMDPRPGHPGLLQETLKELFLFPYQVSKAELWFIVHFNCGKDLTECKVKSFSKAWGGMG